MPTRFISKINRKLAFTFIELSIALIIIGLIAGGILLGANMIKSAENRQYLSSLDAYRSSIKAFELKYGSLPGDISPSKAVKVGLPARAAPSPWAAGQGDGDGIISGALAASRRFTANGEITQLWADLSSAGFVPGTYSGTNLSNLGYADLSLIFPRSTLGGSWDIFYGDVLTGKNYFTQVSSSFTSTNGYGVFGGSAPITPLQALDVDSKIDDGMALTGKVTARVNIYNSPTTPILATAATPASGVCVSNITNTYNTVNNYGNIAACMVQIPYD